MSTKLVDRASIKDLLGIARADSLYDQTFNRLITEASEFVTNYCRRNFLKGARTEFYRSYDQWPGDQDPQYIWLDGPIDLTAQFEITYAAHQDRDTNGVILVKDEDYRIDLEQSLVTVYTVSTLYLRVALLTKALIEYSPTGFRVKYTGGYPITTGTPTDPMEYPS